MQAPHAVPLPQHNVLRDVLVTRYLLFNVFHVLFVLSCKPSPHSSTTQCNNTQHYAASRNITQHHAASLTIIQRTSIPNYTTIVSNTMYLALKTQGSSFPHFPFICEHNLLLCRIHLDVYKWVLDDWKKRENKKNVLHQC